MEAWIDPIMELVEVPPAHSLRLQYVEHALTVCRRQAPPLRTKVVTQAVVGLGEARRHLWAESLTQVFGCAAAWKKDPLSGVIGAEEGPLIPMV